MEVTNIQKYIHTTPRKLRLVADMVRNMEPEMALETLRFTNKMAANDLSKAIKSALASAHIKGMEKISFEKLEINEGPKMRRMRAGSRGHSNPFKRRMAHIKIVLTDDFKVKSEKSKVAEGEPRQRWVKSQKTKKEKK